MSGDPNRHSVHLRMETYRALCRVREDESYPTFDQLIMEALRAKFGTRYDF